MKNRLAIGGRIKDLRKRNNFSQSFVAEKLFISQAAYSLIESSQNGIVLDHIINLSKLYEVTTDFLLKGDKNLIKISPKEGFVPLVNVEAHAGFIKKMDEELSFADYEWFRIPGFNPAFEQKLFEIDGESMAPTVLPKDIIICQSQPKIENILDGSLVLLITAKEIIVKRIRLNNNPEYFLLENDNPGMGEVHKMKKSEIKAAMIVRGKISSVLVPNHEIASKGKLQALEDTVDFLKKELFKLNKKLNSMIKSST